MARRHRPTVLGLPAGKRWGNMPGAQAIFLDPAGNALDLHHRYSPAAG